MPVNSNSWPYNPSSNLVDKEPQWREVSTWGTWPINKIRQVSVTSLQALMKTNLFDWLDPTTQHVILAITEGRPVGDSNELMTLTPEKLTSLANQSDRNETARAGIDVGGLFALAAQAISSGDLCGVPVTARDKIQLLIWLGNKAIPDAKTVEMQEVVQRVDRGRRKLSTMTAADIAKLNKEELLDLMQYEPPADE